MNRKLRLEMQRIWKGLMIENLPEFTLQDIRTIYLRRDELLWVREAEGFNEYIILSPSPKGEDEYVVELAWSRLGRFPELSMRPYLVRDRDIEQPEKFAEGSVRLPYVVPHRIADHFRVKFENLEESLRTQMAELLTFGIPYLERAKSVVEPCNEAAPIDMMVDKVTKAMTILREVPYLIHSGPLPTFAVVRELLLRGEDDAGMSGYVNWQPFEIDVVEYEGIVKGLMKAIPGSYRKDAPASVSTVEEWMSWRMAEEMGEGRERYCEIDKRRKELEVEIEAAVRQKNFSTVGHLYIELMGIQSETCDLIIRMKSKKAHE